MAHVGEELAFGAGCFLGGAAGLIDQGLGLLALGDVGEDADPTRGPAFAVLPG